MTKINFEINMKSFGSEGTVKLVSTLINVVVVILHNTADLEKEI